MHRNSQKQLPKHKSDLSSTWDTKYPCFWSPNICSLNFLPNKQTFTSYNGREAFERYVLPDYSSFPSFR